MSRRLAVEESQASQAMARAIDVAIRRWEYDGGCRQHHL